MWGNAVHTMNVSVLSSIDDVDPGLWDSIVSPNEVINSHAYQRAIEKSGVNDISYRYFLFYRDGELIGHASAGIFTFGLDVMVTGSLKRLLTGIKRVFPGFLQLRVLECGHPTALGSTVVSKRKEETAEIISVLGQELTELAKKEKILLIDIRDAYSSALPNFRPLTSQGYKVVPNMSNTTFRVYQRDFDEYLHDLVSKRRHETVHRLRVFQESGCTIELLEDFSHLVPQIIDLWRQTFAQAKEYQREVLNESYFRNLSEFLGDKSFLLLCKQGDKPIGFTVLLDSGNSLVSTYCGLDYSLNRSTYAYFVLFYRSIEEAIKRGKDWLELGVTNYNPKVEIGALLEPMFIYTKSGNALMNLIVAPLLRLTTSVPDYHTKRVYNNRYYERHAVTEPIAVRVGGKQYALCEVSEEGLGMEGESRMRVRSSASFAVEVEPGKTVLVAAHVKNVRQLAGGRWRIGCAVHPTTIDGRRTWVDFVRRYAARSATGAESTA